MQGCELAELVLSRSMSLQVICTGEGLVTMAYAGGDPAEVLAIFRAAAEGQGGSMRLEGSTVYLAFPVVDRGATLAVPGAGPSGPVPFISVGDAGVSVDMERRFHVFPVPSGFDASDVQEVAQLLGVRVLAGSVNGADWIGSNDRETLLDVLAMLSEGELQGVRLSVAEGDLTAVSGIAQAHGVEAQSVTGGLVLLGARDAVADVMRLARAVSPQPRDLAVQVAFLSFSRGDALALSAELEGSRSGGGGTITLGTAASGLSVVVDGLVSRSGATVEARPSMVVRSGGTARFQSGQSVPVISETTADNGTTVQAVEYREAGLIVTVTPVLIGGVVVEAAISVELSAVDQTGEAPSFFVDQIETVSRFGLGDVVLLSGLADTRAERAIRGGLLSSFLRGRSDRVVQVALSVTAD